MTFFPQGTANVVLAGPGRAENLPERAWYLSEHHLVGRTTKNRRVFISGSSPREVTELNGLEPSSSRESSSYRSTYIGYREGHSRR